MIKYIHLQHMIKAKDCLIFGYLVGKDFASCWVFWLGLIPLLPGFDASAASFCIRALTLKQIDELQKQEIYIGCNTAGGQELACIQMKITYITYVSLCTKWKYLIGSNWWSKSCLGVGWRTPETSFLSSDPSFCMSPLLGCKLAAGFDGALDQKIFVTYSDTIK